ncbi:uroporphyrinogen-III C-methyltransferase [Plebeiibacterium sediminum]|uniref:uroporphyrinogen-III C-methyltransferase n=1 Tax=Plebeiibacterium sediminum TaxID=2992112 RepID=A0AAE3M9F3_9BACT|nr:uroporphyrinogen-III C-methyltransferase [Plebeiobacterium sediminum]MCW3789040.1 uroporphyrinogen-III C-methyltransferase [Plebeiobacterium sediminum]
MNTINIITNSSSVISLKHWLDKINLDQSYQISLPSGDVFNSLSETKDSVAIIEGQDVAYPLSHDLEIYAVVRNTSFYEEEDQISLQNYLVVIGLKNDEKTKTLFSDFDLRPQWGSVSLAGFGPGDYSLITRRAESDLLKADIIFYDDLIDQEYLNKFSAEKVYVGKRKGAHKFDQTQINELMYQAALKGKDVVRIKGGDPLIFGRGAEEYHYLAKRWIDAEIIAGITSAFAAAASAVIPLTERSLSSSVALLSGHDLNKLRIPKADTLVFYMGASQQQELAARIIEEGWHENTPVGIVHNASKSNQQIYRGTLAKLKNESSGLPSPSIIIVGKTAREYQDNPDKWLYTGVSVNDWQKDENIVHTPLINIEEVSIIDTLKSAINNINQYHRIVFTNRYSVQYFFELLFELGLDVRHLGSVKIDCLGKSTSEVLRNRGLLVKPFAEEETSLAMLQKYKETGVVNENILIPGSDQTNSVLREGLIKLGNHVDKLQVYQKVRNHSIVKQNIDQFKGVIFTSPQEVEIFKEVYGEIPQRLQIKATGTRTRSSLEQEKGIFKISEIQGASKFEYHSLQ